MHDTATALAHHFVTFAATTAHHRSRSSFTIIFATIVKTIITRGGGYRTKQNKFEHKVVVDYTFLHRLYLEGNCTLSGAGAKDRQQHKVNVCEIERFWTGKTDIKNYFLNHVVYTYLLGWNTNAWSSG